MSANHYYIKFVASEQTQRNLQSVHHDCCCCLAIARCFFIEARLLRLILAPGLAPIPLPNHTQGGHTRHAHNETRSTTERKRGGLYTLLLSFDHILKILQSFLTLDSKSEEE